MRDRLRHLLAVEGPTGGELGVSGMKHQHPWLARLAKVALVFGLAAGLAAAGATALSAGGWGTGFGKQWLVVLRSATSAGQVGQVAVSQVETVATVVAAPGAWTLAAWLLRRAAGGRLRVVGGVPSLARWLAVAGMVLGALAIPLGVMLWENPMNSAANEYREYRAATRLKRAIADGTTYNFWPELVPGYTGRSAGSGSGPRTGEAHQAVLTACVEGYGLFTGVRTPGILFLLSATVFCLSRPDPDPDT